MSELTHVELLWIRNQVENRIRFGRSVDQHIIDRQWRIVSFEAGSIFAFVRWAGNEYGTTVSRIDILRAIAPGERYITVPYVRPGGESLLQISGWPKVEKVLQAIEAIEALGIDPADAAPETGSMSTIACRSASGRDPIHGLGIKPGCIDGSSSHDKPSHSACHRCSCRCRDRDHARPKTCTAFRLEHLRKRSDRALSGAAST
jgi:Protein of unknown function (DUF2840)